MGAVEDNRFKVEEQRRFVEDYSKVIDGIWYAGAGIESINIQNQLYPVEEAVTTDLKELINVLKRVESRFQELCTEVKKTR